MYADVILLAGDYTGTTPPQPARGKMIADLDGGLEPLTGKRLFAGAIHFNCDWPPVKVNEDKHIVLFEC